jgi:hypothetical protein
MTAVPAALGLTPDQVAGLLATASTAPSLHNSQPWRFLVRPQVIELWADPQRRLPAADATGREQRLACGAALFNLRLALHGLGIRPLVTVHADGGDQDLLASVRFGGRRPATAVQQRLLAAVPRRPTNRMPFTHEPVTTAERAALHRAAVDEGAWLHLVERDQERRDLARLAAQAQATQHADPAYRAEVAAWAAVSDTSAGIPFEQDRAIAVLTSYAFGPYADVVAGQAMQRVLLTATAHGLAASSLFQLIEVERAREERRRLIGAPRGPQVVLRIRRGRPVPASPRRAVDDLVLHAVPERV